MSRWPLLLLVLAACALGLAACGGDDGGGDDQDVAAILSETFGEGKEVKSGRLDVAFRLNAKGLQGVNGPVGIRLNGPFQSSGDNQLPQFDFNAGLELSGTNIKAGAVSTGDKGFLRFQDQAYTVSDELYEQFRKGYAEQAKCSTEQEGNGQTFGALGVRPARWLRDAKKLGEEEVGGAEATRISASIDVPRFLEDVNRILSRTNPEQADPCADEAEQPRNGQPRPRQLSEAERKQITEAVKNAKVEIWTGAEDRIMRRMNVRLGFDVPQAQRRQAGGLESGDIRFDLTIGALNKKQAIKAPAGARPLEELQSQLGGAVPGLGGAGGGGGAGAGAATPPAGGATPQAGAASNPEYQECLAGAGQDVKKLQECSELVGR